MTTRIRIQHLDDAFPIEAQVIDKGAEGTADVPPGPDKLRESRTLAGKGDEAEFYIHSGCYLTIRELPPQ